MKKTLNKDMKKVYTLYPYYDSRLSFYGKALVYEDNKYIMLYSYLSEVLIIDKDDKKYCLNNKISCEYLLSNTTLRHIKEVLKQLNIIDDIHKSDLKKLLSSKKAVNNYDPTLQKLFN